MQANLTSSSSRFVPQCALDIFAGGSQSGLIDENGDVWMWGANQYGQLGIGTKSAGVWLPTKLNRVWGNSILLTISIGPFHTLLLDKKNGVCWSFGRNNFGQLGTSGESPQGNVSLPSVVLSSCIPRPAWKYACAGKFYSLFLDQGGTLWSVGSNDYGQLGVSTAQDFRSVGNCTRTNFFVIDFPKEDNENFTVSGVSCGDEHSLVITSDGSLWSFGSNLYGQLFIEINVGNVNSNLPRRIDPFLFSGNAAAATPQLPIGVWTKGYSSFVQTNRTVCKSGSYSLDGLQPCFNCSAGTATLVIRSNGSSPCKMCSSGTYSLIGASSCVDCEFGTYSTWEGMSICRKCPSDRPKTANMRSTSIFQCIPACFPGSAGPDGGPICTECLPGKYASSSEMSQCTNCEIGKYQSNSNQTSCVDCAEGQSTLNLSQTSSDSCLSICAPGEFSDNGLSNCSNCTCTKCGLGTYQDGDQSIGCRPCAIDSFGNMSGLTVCTVCPPSTGTVQTGSTALYECLPLCMAGTFSPTGLDTSAASCIACPEGKFSNVSKATNCTDCQPGFSSSSASTICSICEVGKFSAGYGNSLCENCQLGSYQEDDGQSTCFPCFMGSFANITGQSACWACPELLSTNRSGSSSINECAAFCNPGFFSDTGMEKCLQCPAGKSSTSSGSRTCNPCWSGSYSTVNMTSCTNCSAGTVPSSAATACETCVTGKFSIEGQASCSLCEAGKFGNGNGSSRCFPCLSGTFQNMSGSIDCKPCELGRFSGDAAVSCDLCPRGSFGNASGCFECGPGTYQDVNGSTICKLCILGKYLTATRATSLQCQDCPAGMISNLEGSSLCRVCPPGQYSDVLKTSCVSCQAGKYASQSANIYCDSCSPGTYQGASNASVCVNCAAGLFSLASWSSCQLCPQGKYSSQSSSSECQFCMAGKSTNGSIAVSASSCRPICVNGTFGLLGLSDFGQTICSACPVGKFSMSSINTGCDDCTAGKFSQGQASACTLCTQGFFSEVRAGSCSKCLPSTFASNGGSSACSKCSQGKYSSDYGTSTCNDCGAGTFSPEASSVCYACPPGTEARQGVNVTAGCDLCISGKYSNGGNCVACPLDTFNEKTGASVCSACPQGYGTLGYGATSRATCIPDCDPGSFGLAQGLETIQMPCIPCAAGMYQPFFKQTSCIFCPMGKFSDSSGASYCKDCQLHTFANNSGQSSCALCPNSTFTLNTGAVDATYCRIIQPEICQDSPRHYAAYPVFGAGSNSNGQTIKTSMLGQGGDVTNQPGLVLCSLIGEWEVISFETSGQHTFLETGLLDKNKSQVVSARKLWSFGLNDKGQLGSSMDQLNSYIPLLVPTILFPNLTSGNKISAALQNNLFYYWRWDDLNESRTLYTLSLDDGLYGPLDIYTSLDLKSQQIGHPAGWLQIQYDEYSQGATLSVQAPGFQVDFTFQNTCRYLLGFGSPVKIPSDYMGTLNEVSEELGNNVLRYRLWCSSWPKCATYRDVAIVLPNAIYNLDMLTSEISKAAFENGDNQDALKFYMFKDKVIATIGQNGIQLLFQNSKLAIDTLGFDDADFPVWGPWNGSLSATLYAKNDRPYLGSDWTKNVNSGLVNLNSETSISQGQFNVQTSLGIEHTLILTEDSISKLRRLWSFGSNRYGQLGVVDNVGTDSRNSVPLLIPEFDEINGGSRVTKIQSGAFHNLVKTEDGAVYVFGSNQNKQLGPGVDPSTKYSWKPTLLIPSFANPVNEISSRRGNNVLAYDFWSGTVSISEQLRNRNFRFSAWSNVQRKAVQYSLDVPDGSYTPSQLAIVLNSFILNVTGISNAISLGGSNMGVDDHVRLVLYVPGLKITTSGGQSFFSGNNSLGFQEDVEFPDPSTYGGSSLPNEVSSAAQTNLFHYRFQDSIFKVEIPPSVYNLSSVETAINAGVVLNGHASGAFSFSIDNESRVILQIAYPGFQAVLSGRTNSDYFNNTVGRYLGFLDMDLPCNPAYIVDNLTEMDVISGRYVPNGPYCIAAYSSPNSGSKEFCISNSSIPGSPCGLTLNYSGSVFRKRGAYRRPLISAYTSSGSCGLPGVNGVCSCRDSSVIFVPIETDQMYFPGLESNSSCQKSCFCESSQWGLTAISRWGLRRFKMLAPDFLYSTSTLRKIGFTARAFFAALNHTLEVNVSFEPLNQQIMLKMNVTGPGGFRIDLGASSLSSALDLGTGTIPSSGAIAFAGSCIDPEYPCSVNSSSGSWKFLYGSEISDFSLGRDHTLIQVLNRYTGAKQLYSWGSNQYGQLGTEEGSGMCFDDVSQSTVQCALLYDTTQSVQELRPISISDAVMIPNSIFNDTILAFKAGGLHNLILTEEGRMWCFGSNQHGQCGFESNANPNSLIPNPIPLLVGTRSDGPDNYPPNTERCKPVMEKSSLLCDSSCSGTDQCGTWKFLASCVDCPFGGIKIKAFQAGLGHSVVQTVDGRLWAFGSNSVGQLFQQNSNIGNLNSNPHPSEINPIIFSDGNQPMIGFAAVEDVTLIQTFRPLCTPGNFSVDGRSPCLRCEPGSSGPGMGRRTTNFFSEDQSVLHPIDFVNNIKIKLPAKNLSCDLCPAGKFSSSSSLTLCLSCAVGTYSIQGSSECHNCPAGTFSAPVEASFLNRTSCKLCPAGYSSFSGTSTCFICQPGSYSSYNGSPQCSSCMKGQYSNSSAATVCYICNTASYQNITGGTFCYKCEGNTTTVSTGASTVLQCISFCEAGQYGDPSPLGSPILGTLNCRVCPAGKFSNSSRQLIDGKGATSCGTCAAGKCTPKP
jgi:alpha-tubulin suppressor-like RCC1 family protein